MAVYGRTMAAQVDRDQVMAYRVAALGLAERSKDRPGDLPLLDLGVQEYTPGSVRVGLAARTSADLDDDRLVTVWAARGAPHLHRKRELRALAEALWPVSDADATARIQSGQIPEGMKLGLKAFTATAEAMHEIVTESIPRGEASTRVSKMVPKSLTYDCRSCKARHIAGNVWQHASFAGGVLVESRGKDATLGPIKPWRSVVEKNKGIDKLIRLYLRMLGPATPLEVGKYFGSSTAEMKKVWPDDLAEVSVDGKKRWLPADAVDDLIGAGKVSGVRLIPPMDALLQARDRDLLVPDRKSQKEVWRTLGNPGALLIDGEIAGVWRAKMSGRKRVDLTVTPFGTLSAKNRKAVEAEAAEVARAREVPDAGVTVD
jgi:Winged helix DNA-binding domain